MRLLATLLCLVGCLAGTAAAGASPLLIEGRFPVVPVVLVPGAGASPQHAFGAPVAGSSLPQEGGLYARLVMEGYEPGRTLFCVDHSGLADADYITLAERRLAPVVAGALAVSGAVKVDIVTQSVGALAARWYAGTPVGAGQVRSVVMVAPPNQGSHAANFLHFLFHFVRLMRLQAFTRALPAPVQAPQSLPLFRSEAGYIEQRFQAYWSLLRRDYTRGLAAMRAKEAALSRDFEHWLARHRPELVKANIIQGQTTVWAAAPTGPRAHPPAPEMLTTAYYELLAIRLARAAQWEVGRRNMLLHPPAIEAITGDPATTLGNLAAHYALLIGGYLATREAAPLAMWLLESTREISPAGGLALSCVKAAAKVAVAGPGGVTYLDAVGNAFLHGWNEAETRRRSLSDRRALHEGGDFPHANPKYVVIAGAAATPGRAQLGDGLVEVDDCALPLAANDSFRLTQSLLSATHAGLVYRPDVQDFIARTLRDFLPLERRLLPAVSAAQANRLWRRSWTGKGYLSPWYPDFVRVDTAKLAAPVRLSLALTVAGTDAAPRVWLYLLRAGAPVLERRELTAKLTSGKYVTEGEVADAQGYRMIYLGARLPAVTRDLAKLYRTRKAPYSYQVSLHIEGRTPAKPDPPATTPPAPPQPVAPPPPPLPLPEPIHVVRASKQTTHRDEDRTYHVLWTWDFGDGRRLEQPGPGLRSTVSHTYGKDGGYTVTGTSLSNKGTVLRSKTWAIPAKAGQTFEFSLETVAEPTVRITLIAPRLWVTGRPAAFQVVPEVLMPDGARAEQITIDPGREFQVVWERPGRFTVKAAVSVKCTYVFPERTLTLTQVHVAEVGVDVLAVVQTD
ncbi:MAG: PKD domain-containing protein [Bacillota bacterium]